MYYLLDVVSFCRLGSTFDIVRFVKSKGMNTLRLKHVTVSTFEGGHLFVNFVGDYYSNFFNFGKKLLITLYTCRGILV